MSDNVLFVAPAKLYPVDADGKPVQHVRENVSLPALTVLGSLKSHGFEVDFMDLSADGYENQTPINEKVCRFGLPDEAVIERISETKPLALLITSMFTSEQQMVDDLTAKVKRACPDLPIIVGGIHATLKPDWILESGNVDFVVLGEGEETAPKLIKAILSGNMGSIGGVAYIKDGKPKSLGRSPHILNLDREWAFDETLLREGEYRYKEVVSRRSFIYANMTKPEWTKSFGLYYSKGCHNHCPYCGTSERDGMNVRHMGSRRMFDDFQTLHQKYGVRIFYNQADTFGSNKEDIEFLEKVREYRRSNPDFAMNNPNAFLLKKFFPLSRSYQLDEKYLNLLSAAGFNVITIAVETFNQRFNKKINFDDTPPKKIEELFAEIHGMGIKTEIYMMYAFPGQTGEELERDEKIVESMQHIDEVAWQGCMIFPGTEYYREILSSKRLTEEDYRKALIEGYFFHNTPDALNFSKIPSSGLREFRKRHRPSI